MRILVTGVSGLLGSNLALALASHHEVVGSYATHAVAIAGATCLQADLLSPDDVHELFDRGPFDAIIHCASLASVDGCEASPEQAERFNVVMTRQLVERMGAESGRLVYVSTDAVYPGERGPYPENGPIAAQNVYGRSKLAGEQEALARSGTLVLRTNFYGWNVQPKSSFLEWLLGAMESGKRVSCFRDARFSSLYTMDFADLLCLALQRKLSGVYNFGTRDSMSKYDFGCLVARYAGIDENCIRSSTLASAGLAARRGKDLSLDVSRLEQDLGIKLPTIDDGLKRAFRDRAAAVPQKIAAGLL